MLSNTAHLGWTLISDPAINAFVKELFKEGLISNHVSLPLSLVGLLALLLLGSDSRAFFSDDC